MCVIIGVPEGIARPDDETLFAAEKQNSHGGSIAWIGDHKGKKQVFWKKGITAKEIIELLPQSGPYVIHFRIATRGGQAKELCHPFPIAPGVSLNLSGHANSVLFHNGTWHNFREIIMRHAERPFPQGPWSDTRGLAYMAWKFGHDFMEMPDEKVCILTTDNFYIFKQEAWTIENGVYFSNTIFRNKSKGYTTRVYDAKTGKWDDETSPYAGYGEYGYSWSKDNKSSKGDSKSESKSEAPKETAAPDKKDTPAETDEIAVEDILKEAIAEIKMYMTGFEHLPATEQAQMIEDFTGIIVSPQDVKELFTELNEEKKSTDDRQGNIYYYG
jgi:hypothetical protein